MWDNVISQKCNPNLKPAIPAVVISGKGVGFSDYAPYTSDRIKADFYQILKN